MVSESVKLHNVLTCGNIESVKLGTGSLPFALPMLSEDQNVAVFVNAATVSEVVDRKLGGASTERAETARRGRLSCLVRVVVLAA